MKWNIFNKQTKRLTDPTRARVNFGLGVGFLSVFGTQRKKMSDIRWLPLEANPEVMNKFLNQLGVPKKYGISDIFSFDAEMLQFVPKPSYALILLFPATSEFYKISANKQFLDEKQVKESSVFFMKQTIRNACGTVALIHSIANNLQNICLESGSPLEKFLKETVQLGPDEKAEYLENNMDIGAAHEASAQEGQTEPPPTNEDVTLHFVALVNCNGKLLELDGRQDGPICHGSTSEGTFFEDACEVCKEYMSRDPENLAFTALSFGALE